MYQPPSDTQVARIRTALSVGILEAKRIAVRNNLAEAINTASSVEEIRAILRVIVEETFNV